MKKSHSSVWLILLLVLLSAALYTIQIFRFNAPRDTAFYFVQDMAFLPLQVAIVTVVLGKVFKEREKQERLNGINMAIGAFFSEAGNTFLTELLKFCADPWQFENSLCITQMWTNRDYQRALKTVRSRSLSIDRRNGDLRTLKILLSEKRGFLLGMLANPHLLEHDTFTDMLWAVFHLADELAAREIITQLPDSDLDHLEGDIKRAVSGLIVQWLSHMAHLQTEYPYLFSLEIRKNPFCKTDGTIVR